MSEAAAGPARAEPAETMRRVLCFRAGTARLRQSEATADAVPLPAVNPAETAVSHAVNPAEPCADRVCRALAGADRAEETSFRASGTVKITGRVPDAVNA